MKRNSVFIRLAIILGIVVLVNLISNRLYFRLDFTADKRYTLSEATKNILEELDDVVTVKAYFSEDLPPQLLSNRQDFEDQLVEYENRSGGNVVYEFINPNENEEIELEAQQSGISPVIINVTEKDQVQQLKAYMGAVITMADRTEVIPLIQPGAGMEYSLTTSIKKISIADKPKIALLQGHGELPLNSLLQLQQQLSVLYDVEPFTIGADPIPAFYKAVAIVNPTDTIPSSDLAKLDDFMNLGGNIFVAKSMVSGDLSTAQLSRSPDIGISSWLRDKGVNMGNNFVIDVNCASVSVRQQQGYFTINSQVTFPYFPRANNFGDHPIAQGLEDVLLPFVNSIQVTRADSALSVTPLILSSEQSGLVNPPAYVDINKKWATSDFPLQEQILAVALEGNIMPSASSKLVVVANGEFVSNGENGQQQQSADNVNFASNAIDWLSDDTGLIDLRTKGITSRPLDQTEDDTKALLKYGNVFIPILLVLIYAFVRKQANLRRKQKWMEGVY
ncbi:MAG: Gldg family protein [Bacteroidota bacterium]